MPPTTSKKRQDEDEAHREFLLQACRAGAVRAKLIEADITSVGVALKGRLIDTETAVRWLRESNLLEFFIGVLPEAMGKLSAPVEGASK